MRANNLKSDLALAANQSIEEKKYWLQNLSGDIGKCSFPYDNHNGANDANEWAEETGALPEKIGLRLLKLSNGSDPRLHMILAALAAYLLHRYSGQENVIIGTVIDRAESQGNFINTILPLRYQFTDEMNVKDLLMMSKSVIDGAIEHQNYPIESLLNDLDMVFSAGDFPLFDVTVLLDNIHDRDYLKPVKTAIMMEFHSQDNAIQWRIVYNTARYQRATIQRLTGYYIATAETLLFDVSAPLLQADILSADERERLLHTFNATELDYPRQHTIGQLVAERVEQQPDAIAIIDRNSHVSFRELALRAAAITKRLRNQGAVRGDISVLLIQRSAHMVEAMLGVLNSGGAYLPLDYKLPEQRNILVIKDSGAKFLLTQSSIIDNYPDTERCFDPSAVARLDSLTEDAVKTETVEPSAANDLAYVIYTSGTTGTPKGVMIEHRNVVNFIFGLRHDVYNLYQGPLNLALVSSFIFDASVQQTFAALFFGHRLYIVPEETRADGAALADFYLHRCIDVSDGTPTHINLLLQSFPPQGVDMAIKHFITGGDVLPLHTVRDFMDFFVGQTPTITNVYGPTECTVNATSFRVTPQRAKELNHLPIGGPIPNYQIYILDKHHRLTPLGAPGELCVSGDSVARGYLGREDLTAEKFVPNPFQEGAVMYKTGDLARWLPDGVIEFIGRKDHQVKIRGYRIELDEIQTRTALHPEVKQTVVTVWNRGNDDKAICAYYVSGQEIPVSEWREFLGGDLPDYMIPSYFVHMDALPLTQTGKIDRKALPEPTLAIDAGYVAPRDHVEKRLTEIWAGVLDVDPSQVGIKSNFFDLGGHSLRATMLISEIHKAFDVRLPLVEIFSTPEIAGLAELVRSAVKDDFLAIEKAPERNYYDLSPAQQRLYVTQKTKESTIAYNIPAAFKVTGPFDIAKAEDCFRRLIKRHDSLRTSFAIVERQVKQKIRPNVDFAIEQIPETRSPETAMKEFLRPFPLDAPPLFRAAVMEMETDRFLMMVDMHHIISDGLSVEVFVKEFMTLYSDGQLDELPLQYKDFAEWQNSPAVRDMIKKQETFWDETFTGEVETLALPYDYPQPDSTSYAGDSIRFTIGKEEFVELKFLCKKYDITPFMLLLSLYNILLSKISGQEDITVGTAVSGRRHADLAKIVGFFVNTLPLRNTPASGMEIADFFTSVKQRTLAAFDHQDYPYEELANKTGPLVSVMFAYQTIDIPDLSLPGLTFEPLDISKNTAKFDMVFNCVEQGGELGVLVQYKIALFKRETIERYIDFFKTIVSEVITDQQQTIGSIQVAADDEQQDMLSQLAMDLEG